MDKLRKLAEEWRNHCRVCEDCGPRPEPYCEWCLALESAADQLVALLDEIEKEEKEARRVAVNSFAKKLDKALADAATDKVTGATEKEGGTK